MPSTFECPFCKSRYNKWVASVWVPETKTDVSTYQCKRIEKLKLSSPLTRGLRNAIVGNKED
jgi:hypothetical protein